MNIRIKKASDLGPLVRQARKAQNLRQDDAAGSIGVSENFLGKVERGSDTVQWGKLFKVLNDLGLKLEVDVPNNLSDNLAAQITPLETTHLSQRKKS